jgi:hypothetical protein
MRLNIASDNFSAWSIGERRKVGILSRIRLVNGSMDRLHVDKVTHAIARTHEIDVSSIAGSDQVLRINKLSRL